MTTETPAAELRARITRALDECRSMIPAAQADVVLSVLRKATQPEIKAAVLSTSEQADTVTAPEVEAHPTLTEWIGEVQEGDGAWMFLGENSDRAFIEKRVANHHKRFSSWADGTPVNRRIVRKTTTYTVAPAP